MAACRARDRISHLAATRRRHSPTAMRLTPPSLFFKGTSLAAHREGAALGCSAPATAALANRTRASKRATAAAVSAEATASRRCCGRSPDGGSCGTKTFSRNGILGQQQRWLVGREGLLLSQVPPVFCLVGSGNYGWRRPRRKHKPHARRLRPRRSRSRRPHKPNMITEAHQAHEALNRKETHRRRGTSKSS